MKKKVYKFDEKFYINFYPDLKTLNNESPIKHFYNHGINEKRVCCQEELDDIVNKNILRIKKQKESFLQYNFKNIENQINILIRRSMRPELFNECIKSVLEQNYSNYHIYICYDEIECLDYLHP